MFWVHEDGEEELPVITDKLFKRILDRPEPMIKLFDLLGGRGEEGAQVAEADALPLPPPMSVFAVCSRRQNRALKRMVLGHTVMPNIQQLRLSLINDVAFVFAFEVAGPELEAMAPAGSVHVGLALGYDDERGVFMVWTDWNNNERSTFFVMPYDAVCGSGADRAADFLAVVHNTNDPEMIEALSLFE